MAVSLFYSSADPAGSGLTAACHAWRTVARHQRRERRVCWRFSVRIWSAVAGQRPVSTGTGLVAGVV
jgi:hypothetical protein